MTPVLEAARRELARGRQPIPVPHGRKSPVEPGWPNLRLTADELPAHFNGQSNLGILNGEASGNQIDIDLDCLEALRLADRFLPATSSVFGRPGKRRSHRLYRCDPLPETKPVQDIDRTMLVEFRTSGTQTVFPPSIHPSGEQITWEQDGEPATIDGHRLLARVSKIAAASILARHWPAEGGRHDAALALAGAFLRARWSEDGVADFIEAVALAAGDEETRDRVAAAVHRDAIGARQVRDRLASACRNCRPDVVDRVREWLGETNSENSEHSESAWEAPIPLAEHAPPPFPTSIFPAWVRAFVEAVALATQTPPALAAMLVLAVLAAACARGFVVQITQDWFEPVNLFTATALPPGERKSAVFRHVTRADEGIRGGRKSLAWRRRLPKQ